MIGDHHGWTAERATLLLRAVDDILGTHRSSNELIPSALNTVERYANNLVEADHGRLKARLRPMRGLKRYRSARIISAGHAFVQNLRRGHYELATDVPDCHRIHTAFEQLAMTI
jgi:transposase, IS6 family